MAGVNAETGQAVTGFLRDEQTRSVVMDASGGAAAQVRLGGIDEAIEYLTFDPSFRTVIVDISGVSEPLNALDRLAEVCLPGTRVVAIGETNDIHFYRQLRSAGVAEYLVKPLTAEAVRMAMEAAPVIAVALQPAQIVQRDQAEFIAVVGSRGGVGSTMVAVSLAYLSAETARLRTALIDLDIVCGAAGLALDAEAGHGLIEALTNPDRIDSLLIASATTKVTENLYLLASEQGPGNAQVVPSDATEKLIANVRQEFRRVVIDVPRWDGQTLRHALAQADTMIFVTDFSLAGARDATRLLQLAHSIAPDARRLVVGNRVNPKKSEDLGRAEIEKALGVKLAAVIPEDSAAVPRALNAGKPVPAAAPNSPVTLALRDLAGMLDRKSEPQPKRLLSRLLGARDREDRR